MSSRLFHKPGLIYFWALNDELRDAEVDRMIAAFADADVSAVCLHPRSGLLLPYGSDDWFAFVRRTVQRCAQRGLDVWLYDEDPYPSGAAGGRLVMDQPEFEGRRIERDQADPNLLPGELFAFPAGRLLWCGLVHEATGETRDLTGRVGVVRREWRMMDPCSSDWYYPATPLYHCKRSDAHVPELALRVPEIPPGFTLQAFTARPSGADQIWGTLPDTLNPAVTQAFLDHTHERYRQCVGEHFGQAIRAMFTDEPKYFGATPWTPGLFDLFQAQFGYDLRPRLWHLFTRDESSQAMLTRLHYRQWIAERFRQAWLEPVAQWCKAHRLPLLGHISPEDDPVEQTACVTNLMPLFDHFELPGIDLIIPAVGDADHPLINIGVVSAASRAQQTGRIGVLSESLAVSGLDATAEQANRILQWQALMGVTTQVIHAAFQSTRGPRLHDAPPDWGPASPRWPGMQPIAQALASIQAVTCDARQIAPVAILWPIRSFNAIAFEAYTHQSPLRDALVDLLLRCLARQVGVHFIDEDMLPRLKVVDGHAAVGRARYSHIVLPECVVIHESSAAALDRLQKAGITLVHAGQGPHWLQTDHDLIATQAAWGDRLDPVAAAASLPSLADITPARADVRCTVWESAGRRTALVMTLGHEACPIAFQGQPFTLQPGQVQLIDLTEKTAIPQAHAEPVC